MTGRRSLRTIPEPVKTIGSVLFEQKNRYRLIRHNERYDKPLGRPDGNRGRLSRRIICKKGNMRFKQRKKGLLPLVVVQLQVYRITGEYGTPNVIHVAIEPDFLPVNTHSLEQTNRECQA